jgi:hypothetical protein
MPSCHSPARPRLHADSEAALDVAAAIHHHESRELVAPDAYGHPRRVIAGCQGIAMLGPG